MPLPAVEAALRQQLQAVRRGRLARRDFIARMAALGLSAPMANLLLADAGLAQAPQAFHYEPTRRGGGGTLKLLFWQGPTLLNPHFATGDKDQEGSRLFYEPLANWDADGNALPILAAEIPSHANGGIAADGKSVTWKLKPGVSWHDGQPFTADDVVFNWQFASDPATASLSMGLFMGTRFEKLDTHTVRVHFEKPSPVWAGPYTTVMIVPRHLFAAYTGARSRESPTNLKPVGTGPYRCIEFKPGDLVRAEANPKYHMPNRPHFDALEIKGGGDAVSAARAVLQTGEYDFAWNLQVEDEILKRMEAGGKGRVAYAPGGGVEFIQLNAADPNTEVAGERASPKSRHPLLSDDAVRQALSLLIDRQAIQANIYGRAGIATPSILNNPARFRSPNMKAEFNVAQAAALLDAAGWKPGADGVRAKGGQALRLLFQTSTNAPRQKTQQIIKQAARQAGIQLDLKSVVGSVFFSSDIGNPDTASKFWADLQMYTNTMGTPDPARFMQQYVSWEISAKANQWQGVNRLRWSNPDYDRAFRAAELEMDPLKRAALFIRMNDLVCGSRYVLPVIYRPDVHGLGQRLMAPLSGWDNALSSVHDWYRTAA